MSTTTSSSIPSASPQSIYAFGSTYFHQLGGATPVALTHQNDDEREEPPVAAFCLTSPPWNPSSSSSSASSSSPSPKYNTTTDSDDLIQDIQCTWTSSVFLTTKGKVYQTGTVHGKMALTPRPVTIRIPLAVAQIAAGRHFCLAKMQGGLAVCSWGAGHFGQLGQGGKIALLQEPMVMERLLPHMIGAPIQQVAAGGWHGLAITTTGKIWAWGSNRRHQCGVLPGSAIVNACDTSSEASLSSTVAYPQPVHCSDANAVFGKVACGRAHSVALDQVTGNVYCWGSSLYGQCGQSSRKTSVPSPRKVETLSQVHLMDIAAGEFHTLALTGGGRVFTWGSGAEGQLGHGVSVTFGKPKLVGDLDFRAIMAGQDWKYHNWHNSMTGLHTSVSTDLSQSQHHAAGASVGGGSTTTGGGADGPFDEARGDAVMASNSESSKVPQVRRNSANTYTPSPTQQFKHKVVGSTAATTASGTEMGDGSETSYTIDTIPGPPLSVDGTKSVESSSMASVLPRITSVHASGSYSAAISSTGHLYTWGYNDVGMLGLPKPTHLINIDNMNPKASSLRQLQGCSFDSRHLVLLPRRVDALADLYITGVSTGPCHLWCWGTPRSSMVVPEEQQQQQQPAVLVGRTLYEVQELRRKKSLYRIRNSQSSRAVVGAATAGKTIQEVIYFDGGAVESPANHHASYVVSEQQQAGVGPSHATEISKGGAVNGTPAAAVAAEVAGTSAVADQSTNHKNVLSKDSTVSDSTDVQAVADNDNSVATESWRFSLGVGSVLRRFSNPRGGIGSEVKERRPVGRMHSQPRLKNEAGTIPPTSASRVAADGEPSATTNTTTPAAAATHTPSKFLSRRPARSRSTPPTQGRSRSLSRASGSISGSITGRYRRNRKQQQPDTADDGGKSEATEEVNNLSQEKQRQTSEQQSQQQNRTSKTNRKRTTKALV